MDIDSIATKAVKLAETHGATQAEAYVITARTSGVYIDDDMPKIGTSVIETGIGLRFILDKKIGFTSSTLTAESLDDLVERAKTMARVSEADPKFKSLPSPKKASGSANKFYNEDTAKSTGDDLTEKALQVVKGASSDRVSVPNGTLRVSSQEFRVVNSLGVDAGSKSTIVFGFFTAKSKDGDQVGEGVQRCWSRDLETIDFPSIGTKLKAQSLEVIKAQAFKGNWKDTIAVLAPSEGIHMLGDLVGGSTSGEVINRRSSQWTDKIGDTVAHRDLTVYDNGVSDLGLMGALVDDEGWPRQKTTIIENGILRSYLFDSYNAYQVDMESTGNGVRRRPRDAHGTFNNAVACASVSLEVPPTNKSVDDIIGEIEQGIYIEHFAWPQVDAMSGAFSNEIRNARLIENGELTTQVKYALLVGNLFESIRGEIMIANDPEVHDRRVMPTMAFPGTEIVGQKQ
jgi:PmbA protein